MHVILRLCVWKPETKKNPNHAETRSDIIQPMC
jgi:hypothetical protein